MPETTISLHQRLTVKINGQKVYLPHRTPYYDIRDVKGYAEVKTLRGKEEKKKLKLGFILFVRLLQTWAECQSEQIVTDLGFGI